MPDLEIRAADAETGETDCAAAQDRGVEVEAGERWRGSDWMWSGGAERVGAGARGYRAAGAGYHGQRTWGEEKLSGGEARVQGSGAA